MYGCMHVCMYAWMYVHVCVLYENRNGCTPTTPNQYYHHPNPYDHRPNPIHPPSQCNLRHHLHVRLDTWETKRFSCRADYALPEFYAKWAATKCCQDAHALPCFMKIMLWVTRICIYSIYTHTEYYRIHIRHWSTYTGTYTCRCVLNRVEHNT